MGEALRKPRYSGALGSKEILPWGNKGRVARSIIIAAGGEAVVTDEEARDWRRFQKKHKELRLENGGHWEPFGTLGDEKWVPD